MSTKAIDDRITEAGVYRGMGLLDEAREIYRQILSGTEEISDTQQRQIQSELQETERLIAILEDKPGPKLAPETLEVIQRAMEKNEDAASIRFGAESLLELGLYKEAYLEFQKLFGLIDQSDVHIAAGVLECMQLLYDAVELPEQIEKFIETATNLQDMQGRHYYSFGLALEQQNDKELAQQLFHTAHERDPDNPDIRSRVAGADGPLKTPGSRYEYLLEQKLLTPEQLQKAEVLAPKMRKSLDMILIEQFKVPKPEIGKSLSLFYNCPFKNFDAKLSVPVELIHSLKKTFLLHDMWVPIAWSKKGIDILMDDPGDIRKTDHIRALIKTRRINLFVGIREDIEAFINFFFEKQVGGDEADGFDDLYSIGDIAFEEDEASAEELEALDESASKVVRLVDQVLVTAYRDGVSDIHVEPSPITNKTTFRFRMDGVCHEYIKAPNSMARGILSRIKIMANLDIAERRLPQDGKIKFRRKGVPQFELRVATIPTAGNYEDAVLRVLAKAGAMKLEDMALSERNMHIMQHILKQPYGLILVVGPTGSGKTTTLHAALGHINQPGIKIWTAEDPVEITQAGLRQVEVKPKIGLNFARIMRSFLRADPDVIMIGEMRDEETASIGIEASLTGHLVLSTLHTNSAPETITRLLDMGLNPLNFSDAFLGVLAQRLVRLLCKECRKAHTPTEAEWEDIIAEFNPERFKATGVAITPEMVLYKAAGCDACAGSGYRGRMGIHELMEGSRAVKAMIKKQSSAEELFFQAEKEGMHTLRQDAILKVLQGYTTMDEVHRVCIS